MYELYQNALDLVDAYEYYENRGCTCFQGNAPCAYCENCPSEKAYDQALIIIENYERNM